MLPDYPGQFQEQARAGAAVIGPDKPNGIERFCVVMRAQQKQRGRGISLAGKLGNQIYEMDFALRSVITECLSRHVPAGTPKLILNVISGFLDSLGASRARPEIHKALNMSNGFFPREFLPDFCLCRAERADLNKRDEKKHSRDR